MKKRILLSFILLNFAGLFGMFRNGAQSCPASLEIVNITGQPTKLSNGTCHYSPNGFSGLSGHPLQVPSIIRKNSVNSPEAYHKRIEWLYAQPVTPPAQTMPEDYPTSRSRSQSETTSKPSRHEVSEKELGAIRQHLATTQYFFLDPPDDEGSSSDSDDEA